MAKKFKKFLALTVALALCLGQIAVPVLADEGGQNITLNVDLSQIPESSDTMTVTTGDAIAAQSDAGPGITEQSSSTTTTWNGTDSNGAQVSGSETSTDFKGVDDATGNTLYEGGSLEGSETSLKTESNEESQTQKDQILSDEEKEFEETGEKVETSTTETTETTDTKEGDWEYGKLEEGTPVADMDASGSGSTTSELPLDLPEPGDVTIQLTPNDPDGTTVIKYIPVEDVLAGLVTLPEDGKYTEITDEDGNVIGYEVITTSTSNDTVTTDSEPVTTEKTYTVPAEVSLPEGVEAGTEILYAEDGTTEVGKIVTEVVPEYDTSGKIIKYTITKTTTKSVETTSYETAIGETTQNTDVGGSAQPQARPADSVTTDPDTGITTTVTVTDLTDSSGAVIGHTVTTTMTDASGGVLGTMTEKRYDTAITTATTTTVDPTTEETIISAEEVTTEVTEITAETTVTETEMVTSRLNEYVTTSMTQRDYAYVEINGKLYFIYTGNMTVTEGQGHGDTSLMEPVQPMESLMAANSSQDLDKGGDDVWDTRAPDEGFRYIGHGIDPSLNISKGNSSSDVVQFRLKSADGKEYYAMCIDFNTSIQKGHMYDIQDITSEEYYQQEGNLDIETAEKIRSVALNGYWGTASDVGSMADVKAFLKTYLTGTLEMSETEAQGIVNSLTPGQAVAATQAALWKFGNKDGSAKVNEDNLVPNGWEETWEQNRWGRWEKDYVKTEDYINTEYLYDALLAAANDPNAQLEADEGVEFLDAEDVTGGSITVKSKVVNNAANEDNDPDNDVYNTDIGFTLGIEPSKLNGDLVVTVTVDGKQVKKVRLAGEDVNFSLLRITADENGVYTIPNVEVAEGVKINLNISGTQDLGTGVYIYTSLEGDFNDSQTLVTLATGSRQVNLDMSMNFSVEEPDAAANLVEGHETDVVRTVDTQTGTKTDVTTKSETTTTTKYNKSQTTSGTIRKTVYADVTIDKITTEETKTERFWESFWRKDIAQEPEEHTEPSDPSEPTKPSEPTEPTDPEPTDPVPLDVEEEPEIPDAEVPLAEAPKTGDVSLIWVALSGLSASGLVVLNKKRED